MTDLERLWDDYPTGRPPVREILAAAAPQPGPAARHRRLVVRPLLTAAAVTGLAGAFAAGTLVAGSDGPGGEGSAPGAGDLPSHVAFQADLPAAESCDDLLAAYRERGRARVTAWGWQSVLHWVDPLATGLNTQVRDLGAVVDDRALRYEAAAKMPRTSRSVNSETGTNVQEAAVDEPDSVKTDGELLVTVRDDELTTYDVTGSSTRELGRIDLPGIEGAEILLSGDTVVAVGTDQRSRGREAGKLGHHRPTDLLGTRVLTLSIADPAAPEVVDDVTYDAAVVSARQHGPTVRLVLSSGLPDLPFVEPRGKRSYRQALDHNRGLVERSTIEDWLPTITVAADGGGRGQQLLDCTDVAIPSDELDVDTTSVVGFDAGSPDSVEAIGIAGAVDIAYESADHLYLVAGPRAGGCWDLCGDRPSPGPWGDGPGGTSYLFDFALDGAAATHVASGEVEGAVRDRWSVDAADGVLRLAVGPTSETGNFNSIVTLERDGQRLVERGRLDGLGRNEDIRSMRWFDDLAIMVTFRQVDPLYAIDLTDTRRPRLLGALKIPGFSSYLHPLGSRRMVGVGEGPDGNGGWGAQVGLFNVVDLRKVRRMDVVTYDSGTEALAGYDPRSFTWLPKDRTMLTVVQKWTHRRIGYVSVLRVVDGELRNRMVKVEYGDDVDHVRAVPMPDGRVVLVTGEKAQFFELAR